MLRMACIATPAPCPSHCLLLQGKTPLHLAIARRHTAVALVLLHAMQALGRLMSKLMVDCQDHMGYTPLHYACSLGNVRVARMLMEELDCALSVSRVVYIALHGIKRIVWDCITDLL
jgi:Ankyrin repeats (3 copies)